MKHCNYFAKYLLISILSQFAVFSVYASVITGSINTSALAGSKAEIAFDFIPGDGSTFNSVTISNFVTDGSITPGSAILNSTSASGDLTSTAVLQNTAFLSEIREPITLGHTISFQATVSQNLDPLATIPDALSVYLVDTNNNNLFTTNDPTGANSLFLFNLDGTASGNLNIYTATQNIVNPVTWTFVSSGNVAVPLPGSIWLFACSLIGFVVKGKFKVLG